MKYIDEEIDLLLFEGTNSIPASEKNLRSKLISINRNLQQLLDKKIRIELEIKRQKKVLVRKREELKRISKRNSAKLKIALEDQSLSGTNIPVELNDLRSFDQNLLQESSETLERLMES